MGKRVLVTGGAGFIGSHLCEKLLNQGNEVICLDNLYTGSLRNIKHLRDDHDFEFMRHDITEPLLVEVDEIYNLACPASPVHYQYDPIKTLKTNVIGACNVLGLAKRLNCKVLQASTSEVYGDALQHPQRESYWGNVNPNGIRACYDEGKRAAETLFFDYFRQHGVRIKVVRIFNTYGPRMNPDDGRVVSNFMVQALRGQDITIYGDGSQTRSFCYVDDMVNALVKMMETKDKVAGPINLGNPVEFTIKELAELTLKICAFSVDKPSKIVYSALPADDPRQRRPDISKAKIYLDWEPTTDLRSGLYKVHDYFNNVLNHT
ncbi:MAG: SDR family oxidoreductase [Legionella sp.]|uniref:UDP-glucuronic acid decarboxylase family protein n=1 Tax=Legionella sp. TaxID=459 RepID=UPI002846A933|nr:SDR family oxidoreductase [Legionella sp.]